MNSTDNIGAIIKKIRTEKRLTIKDLAEKSGITSSMLSQLERNLALPSISTVRAIASALDTPLFKIFMELESDVETGYVVKKENRLNIVSGGVEYQLLTPTTNTTIEFMQLTLEPGESTGSKCLSHTGEEVALVLEGTITIQIDDKEFVLNKCDSVKIPPIEKHRWINNSTESATLVFAVTPPSF